MVVLRVVSYVVPWCYHGTTTFYYGKVGCYHDGTMLYNGSAMVVPPCTRVLPW